MPLLSVLCFVLTLWPTLAAELGEPLRRAHAHNDYEHERPLLDALAHGFCSVEADIYLVNGALLVAHEIKEVRAERTLEKLYLEPLREIAERHGGRIFPSGPSLNLLVDIKSEADATYNRLKQVLSGYSNLVTHFDNGQIRTNAVTVILSGNRPREQLLAEGHRLAAFDGRLSDLGSGLPVSFMPLVSDNFSDRFPSAKSGALSAADRAALLAAVKTAHAEGRSIRFWAAGDNDSSWKLLQDAGVDWINTDQLQELARFLRRESKK